MTDVSKFYHDVIEDVIGGVKDELIEDGVDMQVLDELKKLWIAKLEETHVFDPEPVNTTAAQYLNLFQRSQIGPATRVLVSTQPSSHPILTGDSTVRPLGISTTTVARPAVVPVDHGLTRVQLQPQPVMTIQQPQRLPQQTLTSNTLVATAPGVVPANTATGAHIQQSQLQAHRGVIATGLQPGTAPQLAALPSGLTGHLVQIGQQTYLVPQLLNMRQPGAPQLTISQLVGAPPGQTVVTCAAGGVNSEAKTYTLASDGPGFQQTQVDGGHDSDDDKFYDTPSSHQQTPSTSIQVRSVLPQSVQPSDIDDDDDDDDDDDFVPATPGFTPSSVRSNQRYQIHHPGMGGVTPLADAVRRDQLNGGTPIMSGPPTPMTPASVTSRTPATDEGTPVWRRPQPGQTPTSSANTTGPGGVAGRKRRHRPPYQTGDTDTEADHEFDEDGEEVGDEVELMTNATLTPAGQTGDVDDEDDDGLNTERAPKSQRVKRIGTAAHAPSRLKTSRTQAPSADRSLLSPGEDIPEIKAPSRPLGTDMGPDSVVPPDENAGLDEEEEQEEEEEPLNSEDDVSDEEPEVLFESDNVIVCQYDKIHRSRNRWRLHLKDGIMAINGRDLVFQKALGEAEW